MGRRLSSRPAPTDGRRHKSINITYNFGSKGRPVALSKHLSAIRLYTQGAELWRTVVVALAGVLMAAAGQAQLISDQVPHERTLPLREDVQQQLEKSRVRMGIFRLQPSFAIRDLGYDSNVFGTQDNPVGDWRSTISAGTRAIIPLGNKVYLRGTAVPEYTWYQKLTNRRGFGGNYQGSLLGLFNHLSVEGGGAAFKGITLVNSELERAAMGTRTDAYANAELQIFQRLALFGAAHAQRQRYSLTAEDRAQGDHLEDLERNESVARGGIQYRFRSFFSISAAAEKTRTNFQTQTLRNNETNAAVLGIRYDRPRSFLNVSVASRRGEGRDPLSIFPHYRTTTGSYYAAHELASRILLDAYGNRGVVYSLTIVNPYYFETRNGLGLTVPLGRRAAVRAFGETGTNSYPIPIQAVKRTDDVRGWGGGFALRLYRNLTLVAIASDTRYTSNAPDENRSIFRLATSIGLGGGLFR